LQDNDFEWIDGPEPEDWEYDQDYNVLDFKGITFLDCCSYCKGLDDETGNRAHEKDCIMLYDNWCDDPDCDICQQIAERQQEETDLGE